MQDIPTYQAEHRSLKASNGKLHAEVWRLSRERDASTAISATRKQIEANSRRMRTIEYLVRWLQSHGAQL